jgi:small ubiquitin-related modifier
MTNGDIIDVRISMPCTRGACPIPPEQTLPNIHYLASTPRSLAGPARAAGVQETQPVPENNDKITIMIKDQVNASLTLRVKKNTPFRKILEAYAKKAERPSVQCRLYLDGQRLGTEETPAGVDMEEGDLIDVFTEQTGGADEQECDGWDVGCDEGVKFRGRVRGGELGWRCGW